MAVAHWWTAPPAGQVSYLVGADPELLDIALDPLPAAAPAVIHVRPATSGRLGHHIDVLLDELDRAAVVLFPRWLPGAERLDGSGNLGIAAVRALAEQEAARSPIFGPFLGDLAERSLLGRTGDGARFPAEVRAAGLARAIASAYGRDTTVLLIEVPDELTAGDERSLTAAAEWLTSHGHFTVWLAGAPLRVVDRVRSVVVTLPAYLNRLVAEAEVSGDQVSAPALPERRQPFRAGAGTESAHTARTIPVLTIPPFSGLPRPDSRAEVALERELARHEWARGRHWNHTYEWHLLGKSYRLDLFWPEDGLVVEVDGPEHRGRLKYADDRRRDVDLQLLGHYVLRFTNEQVLWDVQTVVVKIKQLLSRRRDEAARHAEGRQDVSQ